MSRADSIRSMTIADCRRERGETLEAFGKAIGLSKSKAHKAETLNRCSLAVALKIEKLSHGRIDAAALNPDVRAARRSAPDRGRYGTGIGQRAA